MFRHSILTKDNLLARGWSGSNKCRFCNEKETLDHVFFHCSLPSYAWGVVKCALGIDMNVGSVHDFCGWIFGVPRKAMGSIAVGVVAVLWALWKSRNKTCFENIYPYDPSSNYAIWLLVRILKIITETRTMRGASQRGKASAASSNWDLQQAQRLGSSGPSHCWLSMIGLVVQDENLESSLWWFDWALLPSWRRCCGRPLLSLWCLEMVGADMVVSVVC